MNSEQHNLTTQNSEQLTIIKDDEIDLIALVKAIWKGRKTIYYSVGISVLIGLVIAFTCPAKYEASAVLLPSEEKDMMGSLGGLGALAGMAGVDIGSMMDGSSGIPAEIYPSVVESYHFKMDMVNQKFNFESYKEPISLYQYAVADTIPSFGEKVLRYTIKLPWTIKDAFKDDELRDTTNYGVIALSKEEIMAMEAVQELVIIEVDKKTGLITVLVEVEEPILSAQIVQKAVELLQEYVIKYKTKQARQNLDFIEERHSEKEKEYLKAREVYFSYKDKHRNIVSERMNVFYEQLKDEFEITGGVYKGLASQLEQAKIKVKEKTPAFTILEPAIVPIEKSAPKKSIIITVSVLIGFFIGLGVIFGYLFYGKIRKLRIE